MKRGRTIFIILVGFNLSMLVFNFGLMKVCDRSAKVSEGKQEQIEQLKSDAYSTLKSKKELVTDILNHELVLIMRNAMSNGWYPFNDETDLYDHSVLEIDNSSDEIKKDLEDLLTVDRVQFEKEIEEYNQLTNSKQWEDELDQLYDLDVAYQNIKEGNYKKALMLLERSMMLRSYGSDYESLISRLSRSSRVFLN